MAFRVSKALRRTNIANRNATKTEKKTREAREVVGSQSQGLLIFGEYGLSQRNEDAMRRWNSGSKGGRR